MQYKIKENNKTKVLELILKLQKEQEDNKILIKKDNVDTNNK